MLVLNALLVLSSPAAARAEVPDDWAFRPATRPAVPDVGSDPWVRNEVDAFVLAKLREKGLSPSPQADRRTLIRRLWFDLLGLPPTPADVKSFVEDASPDAYEKFVDRLLASPHYGERWGRHWLDVVHYGETHGYDKDKPRPNAWPYRDYVIRSFNQDKPYSRFVQEQLAGDVLFPDTPDGVIATGFIAAGPWDFVGHTELREGTADKEITRSLDRDDMLMTAASTFLSLTVHCARCHDHKFDPVSQEDYFRLQAVFAGVDRGDRTYAKEPTHQLVYAAKPLPKPRPIHFLYRGDVKQPKHVVPPGTVEALAAKGQATFNLSDPEQEGQRRAAFAKWVTDPSNLLARRSIVNRVWHYHFGRGIVDTPNDFGKMGSRPTHPELLDWLAYRFLDTGESIKSLHRLILTSSTYRQSSAPNAQKEKLDADNRYLWRMNRTRLDAESLRDAILCVSGKLDTATGGPGVQQFAFKDDHSPVYDYARFDVDSPGANRRSVYRFIVRSVPDPFMDTLDCPDASLLTPRRNTTLTALQALSLLNNPFVVRHSEHFANRVAAACGDADGGAKVAAAFELATGRAPTKDELIVLADYASKHGLANACRLLLNSNEFVFVD
ncbi:MAG TPA: DUF1549 and DUF1553 domain-containing protein [Tepidisphaeraceae bacterium]|nr:DUF1549 and DUF1553 domain-containing protein [Tepidisphaeraceae bacterium]